jgi:hypothetical protein
MAFGWAHGFADVGRSFHLAVDRFGSGAVFAAAALF